VLYSTQFNEKKKKKKLGKQKRVQEKRQFNYGIIFFEVLDSHDIKLTRRLKRITMEALKKNKRFCELSSVKLKSIYL